MAFMFFFFGKPVASLVMQLQDEGFEAVEHVYTTTQYGAQHGVLIGIQSLDPARLKPGNLGIFIPVWELNQNISLVLKRRFHDIVERRQPNWTPFFSQSYAA